MARPSVLRVVTVASSPRTAAAPRIDPADALPSSRASAAHFGGGEGRAHTFVLAANSAPYRLAIRFPAIDAAETCPSIALGAAGRALSSTHVT